MNLRNNNSIAFLFKIAFVILFFMLLGALMQNYALLYAFTILLIVIVFLMVLVIMDVKGLFSSVRFKKKIQTILIVKIIAIIMLFWALADNPYGYYQILRWVIAGVTGYSAYLAYKQGKNAWAWIFAITAILFNPIASIHLDRETWSVLNIIAAAIIFTSIFKMKVAGEEE